MQSVTVLTPHGRRQVVKIEPNKTILWILETVCAKYSEFQAENYNLKHHNKIIDLNQFFRFSGLPNNCTLEMVESDKKRIDQDIVICLQLEDGTRLNGSFQPTKTLLAIITEMCPEKSSLDQSPIVIYMRTEIHGEKLNSTTLKSLGLTSGGRALLRLINSDPESLKVQANVSAPIPKKVKDEDVEEVCRPRRNQTADDVSKAGCSGFQIPNVQEQKKELKKVDKAEMDERMEVDEVERKLVNQQVEAAQNASKLPHDSKNPQSESKTEIDSKIPDKVSKTPQNNPEHPVAQHTQPPHQDPVINILDNRGTIIFSLDSIQTSSMDLPDSFFELTESDVRILYRELRNQVENIENAPLVTSEYRKLEENKKILNQLATYKSCAIRIQLPNRHVIQTKFSTVETIGSVVDFIKQFLVDPEINFYLFQTPPKTILDKNTTLVEANCVPSALLHFGCDEKIEELLKTEYYEKLSSGFGASRVLLSSDDPGSGQSATESVTSQPVPKNFMESKASSKPSGNVPKWFKPSK